MAHGQEPERVAPSRRMESWASWIALLGLIAALVASAIDADGGVVLPLLGVAAVALIVDVSLFVGRLSRTRS
jgi:hypothetical protein